MGRGRAPCCDKSKVKKGPWSPAEDYLLISFIQKQGHDNWRALPQQAGLLRCGKSCRLRWINYLRPDVKRGNFTPEEEETIINLQKTLGNKWSKIASHLPGRTDNEIKNVWNTHLKKRLIGRNDASCHQIKTKDSFASYSSSPSPSSSSCISYGDLNMEKGARVDQGGQESKVDQKEDPLSTMASGKNNSIDEPKEASTSPSHSKAPNTENFCQVKEALWPVEEVSSVDNNNNVNASWEVQKILKEETKEKMGADGIIEIPLEPDADFWNMLDDFDPIDESSDSQPQMYEFLLTSNLGEDHQEDVEYRELLKYLENELELEGNDGDRPRKGTVTEQQHQQLVTKISDNEMMLRPEFDPATAYFSMWPSSP